MIKRALKSVGYILLLLFVYFLFQQCFVFVAVGVAMLYAACKGYVSVDGFADLCSGAQLLAFPGLNGLYTQAMAAALFLSTVAMLLFLYFIRGYRLSLKIFDSISLKPLLYSTMLVLSSMFALNVFVQWLGLEDNSSELIDGLTRNVLGVVTVSLLAPLLEEVLFRGAIQGYMMRRYNPWVGIVSAALVFGIFHFNPVQSAYAVLIGLVFGWIYYRTGSLLSVVVGHVLNNSMATVAMFLFPDDEALQASDAALLSGGQMMSEIIFFLFFVLLSVHFALKLHRSLPPVPSPWRDVSDAV